MQERADEGSSNAARAARESTAALEDTRRMYEEQLESTRLDSDTRVRAAEDRVRAAEHQIHRAEASRQASQKEIARLQVSGANKKNVSSSRGHEHEECSRW